MKHTLPLLAALGLLASQPAAQADIKHGQALLKENCFKCHDASVYQRGERGRVKSFPALTQQVSRCEQAQGLRWFDEDVQDVSNYLNQQYYHFK